MLGIIMLNILLLHTWFYLSYIFLVFYIKLYINELVYLHCRILYLLYNLFRLHNLHVAKIQLSIHVFWKMFTVLCKRSAKQVSPLFDHE